MQSLQFEMKKTIRDEISIVRDEQKLQFEMELNIARDRKIQFEIETKLEFEMKHNYTSS